MNVFFVAKSLVGVLGEDERYSNSTVVAASLAWVLGEGERYSDGFFVAKGLAWVLEGGWMVLQRYFCGKKPGLRVGREGARYGAFVVKRLAWRVFAWE